MSIRKLDQEPDNGGGVVVVTAFACRTRRDLLVLWWLHHRLKPAVQAAAPDFLGVRLFIDWRRRLVRSVSLWARPAGLYAMGEVGGHIAATRVPPRRGITTSCGVYGYRGDWRTVMFGEGFATAPPLQTTTTTTAHDQ
jgi:hypothetical protein